MMNDLLKGFADALLREDKTPITIRNYTNDISLFSSWLSDTYGEMLEPAKTCERDIIEYRSYLNTVRAAAPKTINRRLASITKFFDWCVSQGLSKANPAKGVKGIAITPPLPKALDNTSLRRLLREVHVHGNLKHIAILELLCGSGARVGELVAIQVSQVKLGERSGYVSITNVWCELIDVSHSESWTLRIYNGPKTRQFTLKFLSHTKRYQWQGKSRQRNPAASGCAKGISGMA